MYQKNKFEFHSMFGIQQKLSSHKYVHVIKLHYHQSFCRQLSYYSPNELRLRSCRRISREINQRKCRVGDFFGEKGNITATNHSYLCDKFTAKNRRLIWSQLDVTHGKSFWIPATNFCDNPSTLLEKQNFENASQIRPLSPGQTFLTPNYSFCIQKMNQPLTSFWSGINLPWTSHLWTRTFLISLNLTWNSTSLQPVWKRYHAVHLTISKRNIGTCVEETWTHVAQEVWKN